MKLGIGSYALMWSIGFKGPNPTYPEKEARPTHPLTALGLLQKARVSGCPSGSNRTKSSNR